jgi:hypothetical protein
MEYLIGVALSLAVAALAYLVGFDRERAYYSTALIVIAAYYVLFAAMAASGRTLITEIIFACVFLLFAVVGFKRNLWLVAIGLAGHGVFDFFHHLLVQDPGVPRWWPGFCGIFDVIFGGVAALHLIRRHVTAR